MTIHERFGKFVLLEELEKDSLGVEYRAAKIGSGGFERFVRLLRLSPRALPSAEASQALVHEIRFAAQIHHPSLARVFGMGTIRGHPYVAYDYFEGRSLRNVLDHARDAMLPMSLEQALLIATRIREALDQIHHRKTDSGARYCHGFIHPSTVLISYEGDVRLRGVGYWPSGLIQSLGLDESMLPYLAPEQRDERGAEARSDIYALGCLIYEMYIGEPLFRPGETNLKDRLASTRIRTPTLDEIALPPDIVEMLGKTANAEPSERYANAKELRKPLESMLFKCGSSTTTFNLAYYMHSLFDKEIERETKALADDGAGDFSDFLRSEIPPVVTPRPSQPAEIPFQTAPPPDGAPRPDISASHAPSGASARRQPSASPTPAPVAKRASIAPTSDFSFEIPVARSRAPLVIGVSFAILALAFAAWLAMTHRGTNASAQRESAAMTHGADVTRLEQRIRDLEQQIRDSQEEERDDKASSPTSGTPDFSESNDRATPVPRTPDPAKQRQREDLRRTIQAERRRLEELKRAEEQQWALEHGDAPHESAARETSSLAVAPPQDPPSTPLDTPATTPSAATPVAPAIHSLDEPGLVQPVLRSQPAIRYPRMARLGRIEGEVFVSCIVDESGRVISARVVKGHAMLREEALRQILKRRYSPPTKNGAGVRVRFTTRVVFRLSD